MVRVPTSVVDELRRAEREGYPVEVDRGRGAWVEWMSGFVVSVGEQWMVIQGLTDGVYIDGLEAWRIADVVHVEADREGGYIERAVAELGGRPSVDFELPEEAGTQDVLRAVANYANVIGVYCEPIDSSEIGHLVRLGARKFELQVVDSRGVWADRPIRWWYKDVTRVTFGRRYLEALERYGDERPIP